MSYTFFLSLTTLLACEQLAQVGSKEGFVVNRDTSTLKSWLKVPLGSGFRLFSGTSPRILQNSPNLRTAASATEVRLPPWLDKPSIHFQLLWVGYLAMKPWPVICLMLNSIGTHVRICWHLEVSTASLGDTTACCSRRSKWTFRFIKPQWRSRPGPVFSAWKQIRLLLARRTSGVCQLDYFIGKEIHMNVPVKFFGVLLTTPLYTSLLCNDSPWPGPAGEECCRTQTRHHASSLSRPGPRKPFRIIILNRCSVSCFLEHFFAVCFELKVLHRLR